MSSQQYYSQYRTPEKSSNTLNILGILSLAWAVSALFFGLYCILEAGPIEAEMWNSLIEQGIYPGDLDFDLHTFIVAFGAITAASGALAAITAFLCFVKRFYIIAFVACLISSFLVLPIGIIGIIVAFAILKSKSEFKVIGSTL